MNDFIVEDGILKAYVGPNNITEMEIPEGVVSVANDFIQQKLINEIKLTLPTSLKSFDFLNGFLKVKELVIPAETQLEVLKINLISKEITLPKTVKTVAINGQSFFEDKRKKVLPEVVRFVSGTQLDYISLSDVCCAVLPKDIKIVKENEWHILNVYISHVPYIFYEGQLTESLHEALIGQYNSSGCLFLYENQDIDAIEFVRKKGINYIKTSNGIIVTEINNKLAKLEDLPTELDGIKVIDYNIPEIWRDLYGEQIDKYKSSLDYKSSNYGRDELAEKYGVLYPRLVYKYKQIYALADKAVPVAIAERDAKLKKEASLIAKKNEIESIKKDVESKKNDIKNSKKGKTILIQLGVSAVIAWVLTAVFGGYIRDSIHLDPNGILYYILNSLIIQFAIIFVVAFAISFGVSAIVRHSKKSKLKKLEQEVAGLNAGNTQVQGELNKEANSITVKEMLSIYANFEQACRAYIKRAIEIKDQRARECARLERENKQLLAEIADIAVNGTKEQQAKRAMDKKFSELSDAIRESKSNSPSSYDIFDDHGRKVGEVNKKD